MSGKRRVIGGVWVCGVVYNYFKRTSLGLDLNVGRKDGSPVDVGPVVPHLHDPLAQRQDASAHGIGDEGELEAELLDSAYRWHLRRLKGHQLFGDRVDDAADAARRGTVQEELVHHQAKPDRYTPRPWGGDEGEGEGGDEGEGEREGEGDG